MSFDFDWDCDRLLSMLTNTNEQRQLAEKFATLSAVHKKLLPKAREYDFKDIEANGVRSFLKITECFAKKSIKLLEKNRRNASTVLDLNNFADILLVMCDLFEDYVVNGQRLSLEEKTQKWLSLPEDCYKSFSRLEYFYLDKRHKLAHLILDGLKVVGLHQYGVLFSKELRAKGWSYFHQHSKPSDVYKCLEWGNSIVVTLFGATVLPCDVFKQVRIEAQSVCELQEDGTIVSKTTSNAVKCLAIRNGRSKEFEDVLVFHCHGGGFISMGSKGYQTFTRRVARRMPGATVVTPEYGLAPMAKYPRGLQDLVDAYLALMRYIRSNVDDALPDVRPKKVVILGDSAGGNLAIALLHVLNRINSMNILNVQIEIPKSVVLLFPIEAVTLSLPFPSRINMLVDCCATGSNYAAMAGAYAFGEDNFKARMSDAPWIRRYGIHAVADRIRQMDEKCKRDEFFNPLAGDFAAFANTKLVLIPAEFDSLLDDSIQLANKWPEGMVELIVARGVPHACISEDRLSQHVVALAIDKIKQLVATCSTHLG